jgi:hypothetical protein
MPAGNLGYDRVRDKRLRDNRRFEILRKMASSPRPGNHLQPAHLSRLRLKRMVKRRHKPISKSEIVTIPDRQAQKKVGPQQRLHPSTSWLEIIENFEAGFRAAVRR